MIIKKNGHTKSAATLNTIAVILNLIQDLLAFSRRHFCTKIAGQARNDNFYF
jgi:hypothetical protein